MKRGLIADYPAVLLPFVRPPFGSPIGGRVAAGSECSTPLLSLPIHLRMTTYGR